MAIFNFKLLVYQRVCTSIQPTGDGVGIPISGESLILLDLSDPAALQFLRQRQAQAEAGYGSGEWLVNAW